MIRHIIFSVLLFGIIPGLFAQKTIHITLQQETQEKKEIQISQSNSDGINDFKLFLNIEWKVIEEKNRITLTFDRTNSDGEGLLLCFPLMKKPMSVNKLKACNSLSEKIRKGKGAKSIKQVDYFVQSDDFEKEYQDCFRFVAINNKEEFEFNTALGKDSLSFLLNNLFVIREDRKPWYTLSKRDMRLEYRAEPINIQLILDQAVCNTKNNVALLNEINEKNSELEIIQEKVSNIIRTGKNCYAQLKEIQSEAKMNYSYEQPSWNYSDCEDIHNAFGRYKELLSEITSSSCKSSGEVVSRCPDLKTINKRLMNLQMQIYAKKKEGKTIDKEKKDYLNIKNDTDKKITSDCNKNLLGSYKSFCTYIEDALNK